MDHRTQTTRIAANAVIALLTLIMLLRMLFGWGGETGLLISHGIAAFKYFTVLSNVFSGAVAAIVAVRCARGGEVAPALLALKLAATASVALTFAVVVAFLAPSLGWLAMYAGVNFWFHLALPLAAIVEFCLLEEGSLPPRAELAATVPMLLYGAVYYANILINGVGEWPNLNDFYGFTQWGMEKAPVVFAVIACAT